MSYECVIHKLIVKLILALVLSFGLNFHSNLLAIFQFAVEHMPKTTTLNLLAETVGGLCDLVQCKSLSASPPFPKSPLKLFRSRVNF